MVPGRYPIANVNGGTWRLSSTEHLYYYAYNYGFTGVPVLPTLASIPAAYRQRAFEACLPRMNEGLSLINFILELKDLRRMFDGLFVRMSNIKATTGYDWRELLRVNAKSTLSEFSKVFSRRSGETALSYSKRVAHEVLAEGSGNLLNYSFGWRPFLSDIVGIWNALTKFKLRLKHLKSNEGKVIRRHYRRKLTGYASSTTLRVSELLRTRETYMAAYGASDPSTAKVYESVRWVTPPTYHATLTYRYSIPDISLLSTQIAGLLDALGVNLNAQIVWNAIPFSFVVDWALDVGGFLNRFRIDNLQIRTEVLDFVHSLKSDACCELRTEVLSTTLGKLFKTTIAQRNITRYERQQTSQAAASIGVRLPGVWPVVLGTALGITLHHRHNRANVKDKGGVID